MIDLDFLSGQTIAVLGLGKSGLATARALVAAGVAVRAWDDQPSARSTADAAGVPIVPLDEGGLAASSMLVLSPGIPRHIPAPHPVVAQAEASGVPIIIDADLLGQARPQCRFLGITGTNGKSTTTALIGHVLERADVHSAVGGNLGPPCLGLDPLNPEGWYVLELSSYQLETVSSVPWSVGVLLNFSPDHLDRYADMDAYVAAKMRLFETAAEDATAIIGVDDAHSQACYERLRSDWARRGAGRVIPISAMRPVAGGVYVDDGQLIDGREGRPHPVLDLADAQALPGVHNAQNAAAAYAAAGAVGLQPSVIAAAIRDFPGLAHRQELVAEIGGVRFINDSKATNAEAALKALICYAPIYWIAGGRAKPGGLAGIEPGLANVAHAFLIGEAEAEFAAFLSAHDLPPAWRCGDLESATRIAFEQALRDGRDDAVVLLSPACASFDQFRDFEARGAAFVAAVRRLHSGPAVDRPASGGGTL